MLRAPLSSRRLPALIAALLLAVLMPAMVQADEPQPVSDQLTPVPAGVSYHDTPAGTHLRSLRSWREKEALTAQPAERCEDIAFTDVAEGRVILVATDADVLAESDGSRLCLFFDTLWKSYSAWTLRARTIDEFRRTKQQLQPLIAAAGVDPCDIAFWTTFDQRLRQDVELPDRYDAGRQCPVEIVTHGPAGEQRRQEIETAIAQAADTAQRLFTWNLTWPARVHIYDTLDAFVTGIRDDIGVESASHESVEDVPGITVELMANGGFGQLINLEQLRDPVDLRRVLAHEYAHFVQAGVLGDTDSMPFFVVEGGAEYFASLIVGSEYAGLVRRFREAMTDERTNQAVPLREIVRMPSVDDSTRYGASYTRGYAAIRFLVAEWGLESFVRLHRENIGGTPERFIEAMSRLTGTSLDGFDAGLRRYLLAEAAKPATVGRITFPANSRLITMTTAYVTPSQTLEIRERFTRTHDALRVLLRWECLSAPIREELRLIAPDGRQFSTFGGTSGPGCEEVAGVSLPLDLPIDGLAARALPGTWTIEIFADGALQGTITFIME
ncbi:MAG: hypothetical protein AB7R89_02245 [Dehalococcoidia bacterium]